MTIRCDSLDRHQAQLFCAVIDEPDGSLARQHAYRLYALARLSQTPAWEVKDRDRLLSVLTISEQRIRGHKS